MIELTNMYDRSVWLDIIPVANDKHGIDIYFGVYDAKKDGLLENQCTMSIRELQLAKGVIEEIIEKIINGYISPLPKHEYCNGGCRWADKEAGICNFQGRCTANREAV